MRLGGPGRLGPTHAVAPATAEDQRRREEHGDDGQGQQNVDGLQKALLPCRQGGRRDGRVEPFEAGAAIGRADDHVNVVAIVFKGIGMCFGVNHVTFGTTDHNVSKHFRHGLAG